MSLHRRPVRRWPRQQPPPTRTIFVDHPPLPDQRVVLARFRSNQGLGFQAIIAALALGKGPIRVTITTTDGRTFEGLAIEVDDSNIIRIVRPDGNGVFALVSQETTLYGEFT